MPATTIAAALEGMRCLHTFRARGMVGESFWRLSPAPMVRDMLPTEEVRLMAAFNLNRTQYMPYCAHCGAEVTFEHSVLHTWVHVNEGKADHVAEQTSHPHSHSAPADGLRYLVTYKGSPLVWVLNDGTVVRPALSVPEYVKRQDKVIAAIGERVDLKFT